MEPITETRVNVRATLRSLPVGDEVFFPSDIKTTGIRVAASEAEGSFRVRMVDGGTWVKRIA